MSPVRHAALRALLRIARGAATAADAVDRERQTLEDPRDRALLLELVNGTLRWRNALDAELGEHSRRPVADIDAVVLAILRLSLFQLRHLDRVPSHAVVDDGVELVRTMKQVRATGFVNAVLRSCLRTPSTGALPASPGAGGSWEAQLRYLTITLSHPEWLAARWLDRYGFANTEAWCHYNNEPPGTVIRARPGTERDLDRLMDDPASGVVRSRVLNHVGHIAAGGIARLPAALRDQVIAQDEGSQLLAYATPLPPTGRVLDLCASPGNKTTVLAERAGPGVALFAADFRAGRVERLRATLDARGVSAPVIRLDARLALPFGAAFDTVLVDAPCSGLGTIRREPDLRWKWVPSDLATLAAAQARMLRAAAGAVREGGLVVYATCSSEPEENDDVVRAFLAEQEGFSREPVTLAPPVRSPAAFLEPDGCLRTRPFRDGLDAFYASVLVRRRAA